MTSDAGDTGAHGVTPHAGANRGPDTGHAPGGAPTSGNGPGPGSTPTSGSGPGQPAVRVLGATVDDQTRCVHYRSPLDIVAIRFHCCGDLYPCFRCHAEAVDHPVSAWPATRFDERAILCGVCRSTLPIGTYLEADACPECASPFNPGCSLHHSIYFE